METRLCRILALAAVAAAGVRAAEVDPDLPHYVPSAVAAPAGAGYVQPDGSILEVGAEEMKTGISNLNALFAQTHPGFRFTTELPGSSVGPAEILFHKAIFAIIDRELFPEELVPFQYLYHREPLAFRVGRGSYSKDGLSPTMTICVNRANPLSGLTTEQVARIFTVGGGKGDITTWGQAGLTGDWARRPIHTLGVVQRTGEGVYMKVERFGDYPFSSHYEEHKSVDLAPRLAQEASGIAIIDMARVTPAVKVLAIAESPSRDYVAPTKENVMAGRYPYTRNTYFFVNQDPAKPLDPVVREYMRMVLSREGQEALTDEDNGFLPLSAQAAAAQLRKLNALP